ncbi:MAG: hypothetical protein GX446_04290 [Chthonomonadales bacterium]|nr:hypothetical protein [Chthonomonadales bacterium]
MTRYGRAVLAPLLVLSAYPCIAQVKFVKYQEPTQKAFTAMVPAGWKTSGGVTHWGPEVAGAMNATEAKVEWTVQSPDGAIVGRWLPDVNFIDMTNSPAGGMFPPGSQCNGCISLPRMGPVNYLLKVILPRLAPNAQGVKVISQAEVPEAVKALDQLRALLGVTLPMVYQANLVAVEYTEGGKRYRQLMFAAIEDSIRLGVGLWKSRSTIVFRAPVGQFGDAVATLQQVHNSIQINMEWLAAEMRAAEERTGTVAGTFKRIREIDADIVKNRQQTNEAINKQIQRVLTKVD